MKGYFSIAYDYCTDELSFGKLGFENGGLGYIGDIYSGNRVSTLIAHDVVEHSVKHRTKTYVSYEDEIRAAGSISWIRQDESFDMYQEMMNQISYLRRPLKPVSQAMMKYLLAESYIDTEMMRHFIEEGVAVADARNACYHFGLGRFHKELQYGFQQGKASHAFRFIENNVLDALKAMADEELTTGVSVYFDTEKHIFRWTYKRAS